MDAAHTLIPAFSYEDLLSRAENPRFHEFVREGRLSIEAVSFLKQMHEDALADDLEGISATDMIALAHDFWGFGGKRAPDQQLVRLRPGLGALEAGNEQQGGRPLGRDVVEIIGPDMPFLVDSLMGEMTEQGLNVRAMFHPIVHVLRDSGGARADTGRDVQESYIQIHLEPVPEHRRAALLEGIELTLADIRLSVQDWDHMRRRMTACASEVEALPARDREEKEEIEEAAEFLKWLGGQNFVFVGARNYDYTRLPDGSLAPEEPEILPGSGLGVLRDERLHVLRRGSEPTILTPEVQAFLRESDPLIVGKSNLKGRVHRRVRYDYIGVKRYNSRREPTGETRFIGLFTAEAYNRQAAEVPLLRRKMRRVLERAGKVPGSHSDKRLRNILETFPRDELFQISEPELLRTSLGVLHLMDRPRTKMFLRRDQFDRFVSALVFVPREKFNASVREKIGLLLKEAYDGRLSAFYPDFGEGPLARIHYIIGLSPGHPEPDLRHLEREIIGLAYSWEDDFDAAGRRGGLSPELTEKYRSAFTAGFREAFSGEEALVDIGELEKLAADADGVRVRAFRHAGDDAKTLRCKIYSRGVPIELSRALPILENMGLFVKAETPYRVTTPLASSKMGGGVAVQADWIHDVTMVSADHSDIEFEKVETSFEQCFIAGWTGRTENDGFNRLTLKLGVTWREAALIRALARFRGQSGLDPSQSVQEEAAILYPGLIRHILDLFAVRFDPAKGPANGPAIGMDSGPANGPAIGMDNGPANGPANGMDKAARDNAAGILTKAVKAELQAVPGLDHDRALRRIVLLVNSITRTNFYQKDAQGRAKPYFSFKISSRELEDLPAPKPFREIWVWSPEVEGVHLRFGPVARGGLRWSDRRDDFRTEVLGLVKAQQVKNAVIVPVGSKGGFFPKLLVGADRARQTEIAKSAYLTFLSGLLDLTDNIVENRIVHPVDCVIRDEDDPYLVVAADKGTASFSDIANQKSREYGFWLDDAFASGGGAGYDHKKMGITARGAWEAVKRHFREIGTDIQATPFTVVGVGDMSGDVFGNGMLMSRQTRLLAAFDHRHIFIDPDPQPEPAWHERLRIYRKPASSWDDYDRALISPGGGVFARSLKAIPLNDTIRGLTGLAGEETTPAALIQALLKLPVQLLWFGGIGTFVKASAETHAQASDKANDATRVNAEDLRCLVVGEGANLGLTQAARIAFAIAGGRINTDAVDNSAGVDTSDHEVNIKILLAEAIRAGSLVADARNGLLEEMTENVAELVLRDNYQQTLSLTLGEASAAEDLDAHERLMLRLTEQGRLDRAVEGLPDSARVQARATQSKGLTRPELAVLMAYSKIALFDALVASDVIDDPHFESTLLGYFPPQLGRFSAEMGRHRLKREIVATTLANDIVNFGGPVFIHRVREAAESEGPAIVRAFETGRRIFRIDDFRAEVAALDNQIPAAAQTALLQDSINLMRRQAFWLARRARTTLAAEPIGGLIAAFQPGADRLGDRSIELVSGVERERIDKRAQELRMLGAPDGLARRAAGFKALIPALDIIELAQQHQWPAEGAAALYHSLGGALGFDELREAARALVSRQHWDRLAARRAVEDFYTQQTEAAASAMRSAGAIGDIADAVTRGRQAGADFVTNRKPFVDRLRKSLLDLNADGAWSFAKITIAGAQTREILQARA